MGADRATRIVMSHRLLRRYVLPGERVVLATRRHWAKLLEPALTCLAVFVVVAWLTLTLQPALGERALWLWWLWLAALARLGWYALVWRVEWFVATDKRMLLLTGLVTHQIGMMPLMKVTDMRYSRSVLGQLLGYGQFLLESAGQDQALRSIDWVAHPDATYRDLCALIFTPVAPPGGGEARPASPEAFARAHGMPWPGRAPAAPVAASQPESAYAGGGALAGRPPAVAPARPVAPSAASAPARPGDGDTQPIPRGPRPDPGADQVAPAPRPRPSAGRPAGRPADEPAVRTLPPTLAEASASPLAVEAEAIAGEAALRASEEDAEDRSWDVSEPTATFVRLDPRDPPAPPTRPADGNPDGGDRRPT